MRNLCPKTRREDRLGDLDVDGRTLLKLILNKNEDADWIHVAQGGNQWRALFSAINLLP
jgi:hypothetical protein